MIQYVLAATLLSSPAAHTTEVACRSAPTRLVPTASRGDASGVKLLDVPPGSYWERLGMKSGDLLLRIGDQPIQKPELVCAQLHTAPMPATLDVSRRGDSWRMTVKLGPTPGAHQRVMELCGGDSRMVNATIRGEHAGVKVLRARGALARTGLRAGDLVQRVDGRPVTRPQQMCYALAAAGEAKVVEVSRRGKPVQLRPGN